jgi:hypothetical protein
VTTRVNCGWCVEHLTDSARDRHAGEEIPVGDK